MRPNMQRALGYPAALTFTAKVRAAPAALQKRKSLDGRIRIQYIVYIYTKQCLPHYMRSCELFLYNAYVARIWAHACNAVVSSCPVPSRLNRRSDDAHHPLVHHHRPDRIRE